MRILIASLHFPNKAILQQNVCAGPRQISHFAGVLEFALLQQIRAHLLPLGISTLVLTSNTLSKRSSKFAAACHALHCAQLGNLREQEGVTALLILDLHQPWRTFRFVLGAVNIAMVLAFVRCQGFAGNAILHFATLCKMHITQISTACGLWHAPTGGQITSGCASIGSFGSNALGWLRNASAAVLPFADSALLVSLFRLCLPPTACCIPTALACTLDAFSGLVAGPSRRGFNRLCEASMDVENWYGSLPTLSGSTAIGATISRWIPVNGV
jgi:hypothetical protein